MKALMYRHDDADGFWAAACVVQSLTDTDEYKDVPVNYGKDTWNPEEIAWADVVYVLDFSFNDMPELLEACGSKLVWIDHHKSAMEKFPDIWVSDVSGLRSIEEAGCMLTWKFIFPDRPVPDTIQYVADRDLWQFKLEYTKEFCAAQDIIITSLDHPDVPSLLNSPTDASYNSIDIVLEYVFIGRILLKAQALRVEKAFRRGRDIIFYNLRARLVNSPTDISEIGEYIYKQSCYDIAVIWQAKEDMVIFSLRSNSEDPAAPDCAKLAEKLGGGGHKNAAGFERKDIGFQCIFELPGEQIGCINEDSDLPMVFCNDCTYENDPESCDKYRSGHDDVRLVYE